MRFRTIASLSISMAALLAPVTTQAQLPNPIHAAPVHNAASSPSAEGEAPRYFYALSQHSTVLINAVTPKTGVLRSLGYAPVPGVGAVAMALHPSRAFLYVANSGSNDVAAFSVNAVNGQLTPIGPNVPAGVSPRAITIDPLGHFVYVCDASSNDVFSYSINVNDGSLTPVFSIPAGQGPASLVIDPTETYLFAANSDSNNISVFTLNSGTMTLLQTLSAGTAPVALAMHPSGQFVYAVNKDSNNISAYALSPASGLWNPIADNISTGTAPLSLALTPSGSTLYVANSGSNNLSYYTVNESTGALTPARKKAPAGTTPSWVGVDPTGTFIFVANVGSGDVGDYHIEDNGKPMPKGDTQMGLIKMAATVVGISLTFTPVSGYVTDDNYNGVQAFVPSSDGIAPIAFVGCLPGPWCVADGNEVQADVGPSVVAVDYLGRFAYVANTFGGDVSGYTTDPNFYWALTPTNPSTFQAGSLPGGVVIDVSGRFVYVTNGASGTVSAYKINQSNGNLTHIQNATTGAAPGGIATDPWGRFLYTANGDGGISTFKMSATNGTLTPVPSNPTTGPSPSGIAVADVDGRLYAYVTDDGTSPPFSQGSVYCYSVNPMTGALTLISQIATGDDPYAIAIDPSGRFAYVTNAADYTISEYKINQATGSLTAVGTAGTPFTYGLYGIAVDISGQVAYVAEGTCILVYNIDQTTGVLTLNADYNQVILNGYYRGIALYGTWY